MREGICDGCGKPRWVNFSSLIGPCEGEFCEDCFEKANVLKRRPTQGQPWNRSHDNEPGFDNAIRASEEDRE